MALKWNEKSLKEVFFFPLEHENDDQEKKNERNLNNSKILVHL